MSRLHGINKLVTLVGVLTICVSCACKKFERYNLEGEPGDVLWEDTSTGVILRGRGEDVGFSGYRNWMSLERPLGNETLAYKLDYKQLGMSSNDYYIRKDTLYLFLYNKYFFNNGWHEITNEKITNLSASHNEPLDSSKTAALYGGLYKWKNNQLKKISDNTDDFEEIYKKKETGIYFIPEPGMGIKHKYNLKKMSKELSTVKSIEDASGKLE